VIKRRIERRSNGTTWQRARVAACSSGGDSNRAQHEMLEQFIVNSRSNRPVAEWQP
jgi:hypothetical protein